MKILSIQSYQLNIFFSERILKIKGIKINQRSQRILNRIKTEQEKEEQERKFKIEKLKIFDRIAAK